MASIQYMEISTLKCNISALLMWVFVLFAVAAGVPRRHSCLWVLPLWSKYYRWRLREWPGADLDSVLHLCLAASAVFCLVAFNSVSYHFLDHLFPLTCLYFKWKMFRHINMCLSSTAPCYSGSSFKYLNRWMWCCTTTLRCRFPIIDFVLMLSQVVLWDISAHVTRLQETQPKGKKPSSNSDTFVSTHILSLMCTMLI